MTQATEAPTTGRAANRVRKRQEYIDTAIRIVLNGGLEALTMQALAREMGAAVGTAYTYFASKSALVAELQVLAIGRLTTTFNDAAPRWQAEMGRLDAKGKAEAGLTLLVEFAVRVPKALRDDFFLQQLLLTDGGRSIMAEDQATDDGDAQGLAQLSAIAAADGQGNRPEEGCQGGHQDGPEAQQAGAADRFMRVGAGAARLDREVHHHDGVLLDDADQQQFLLIDPRNRERRHDHGEDEQVVH